MDVPLASGIVNFSFGTYSLTMLSEDGTLSVQIEDWTWDNDQTVLVLEMDGEADRYDLVKFLKRLVLEGLTMIMIITKRLEKKQE